MNASPNRLLYMGFPHTNPCPNDRVCAASILFVWQGHMSETTLEIGVIGTDGVFKILSAAEVKDYLGEVE